MAKNESNVIEVENLTVTKPKVYLVTIKGMDSIIFNKMADQSKSKTELAKQEKTDKAELERLTWREKAYFDNDGMLYIPGENIHQCLKDGCQYWGQRISGEGQKTYTNVIASAGICENMMLGGHKDGDTIIPFGKSTNGNPSKGKKSSMVYKIRPLMRPWSGTFRMHIFDARLSIHVLKTIITYAGAFSGLCDWRPTYGRFEMVDIKEE